MSHFRILVLAFAGVIAAQSAAIAAETVLLKEDWSSRSQGDIPGVPWSIWIGNSQGSVGSISVVEQGSPFGGSGKSILVEGRNPKGAGPRLSAAFPPAKNSILVDFDYYIPAKPGGGVLPTVSLVDAEENAGLKFNLANVFLAPGLVPKIANQGTAWNKGEIIAGFRFDTWYRVELKASRAASGKWTYDATVRSFEGDPVTVKGLEFAGAVKEISGICFSWNSNNSNGAFYVANIKIVTAR